MADKYNNFAELAKEQSLDVDYRIRIQQQLDSNVIVLAPHGGSIERRTTDIASAIAGEEHDLYLFEGLDPDGSFDSLHITSHRFDEPQCLMLVAQFSNVLAVHGCAGKDETIFLGGLDSTLRNSLHTALAESGVSVQNHGHKFQGTHERNICNRGSTGQGVQIEFSDGLRGATAEAIAIEAIQNTLRNQAMP